MKHLALFLCMGFSSLLSAQNQTSVSEGKIYWPDGTIFTDTCTLHIKYDGCPLVDRDYEITDGVLLSPYLIYNPLFGCDTIRISVTAKRDARSGVSVLDLSRLVKHLLGIQPFTNQLQLLASDLNRSGSVSGLDIVELRKMILGVYTEWPGQDALQFVVKTTPDTPAIGVELTSEFAIHANMVPSFLDFWVVQLGEYSHQ